MSKALILKKEDFASWPFSIDIIQVYKKGSGLYVKSDKKEYNLNGAAKNAEPLEKIWLENPEIPGTRISISPIMRKCREFFK